MSDRHLSSEDLVESPEGTAAAHLAGCPICAERRRLLLEVRATIETLDRAAPPPRGALELLERAAQREQQRRRRWAWFALAAAAMGVAVAIVLGVRARTSQPFADAFMDEIALDHLHYVRHPSPAQFTGSREELARWFAPTLGHPMRLASLEATEYIGGRNCWLRGKYAALVLADRASHRLSLFDIPAVAPRRAACGSAQGVRVCAIPDPDGGARVIVGDLPDAEMMRLLVESI
jgi:hypothetical protein